MTYDEVDGKELWEAQLKGCKWAQIVEKLAGTIKIVLKSSIKLWMHFNNNNNKFIDKNNKNINNNNKVNNIPLSFIWFGSWDHSVTKTYNNHHNNNNNNLNRNNDNYNNNNNNNNNNKQSNNKVNNLPLSFVWFASQVRFCWQKHITTITTTTKPTTITNKTTTKSSTDLCHPSDLRLEIVFGDKNK